MAKWIVIVTNQLAGGRSTVEIGPFYRRAEAESEAIKNRNFAYVVSAAVAEVSS